MAISVMVALAGITMAYVMNVMRPSVSDEVHDDFRVIYDLFLNKWWVDELYDKIIVRPLRWIGGIFWTIFDGKGIDGALHGIANGALFSGRMLARLQTGFVQNYALSMAAGLVLILIWALF